MGIEEIVNQRLERAMDGNIYAYEFVRSLGSGGFGQVWDVKRNGVHYALKLPKEIPIRGKFLDPTQRMPKFILDTHRIADEARIWGKLTDNCPDDVVCLLDFNIEPFPWMLMELAECDLWDALGSNKGHVSIDTFIELLYKLNKIHELDVVHRDIKPGNILMINGTWKFSDFGLSKMMSFSTTGSTGGSPLYEAPEQVSRKGYGMTTKKTDIWAMGIMLMVDFLHKNPYPDVNSVEELLGRIYFDSPDLDTVPPQYRAILEKVFVKDPKSRLDNCLDFIEYLKNIAHSVDDTVIHANLSKVGSIPTIYSTSSGMLESDESNCFFKYDKKTQTIFFEGEGFVNIYKTSCEGPIKIAVFEEGITGIGLQTLFSCKTLEKVLLPASLSKVDDYLFLSCPSLKSIELKDLNQSFKVIDNCLYSRDGKELIRVPEGIYFDHLTIDEKVEKICPGAFANCSNIRRITLTNNIKEIGSGSFERCSSLNKIVLSNNIKKIEKRTFWECNSLKSVELYEGITKIDDCAFSGCTALKYVSIPDSVIEFGESSFYGCSITKIKIPKKVEKIGYLAFSHCSKLKTIHIPSLVDFIGTGAFLCCDQLEYISVDNDNKHFCSIGGCLYNKDKTVLIKAIINNNNHHLDIPTGVISIGPWSGSHLSNLESISIPPTVTSLGVGSFSHCDDLKNAVIPSNVRQICDYAFIECNNLTNVKIESGVEHIGKDAFRNCYKLSEIILPSSVTSFGERAFKDCISLNNIRLPSAYIRGAIRYFDLSCLERIESIEKPSLLDPLMIQEVWINHFYKKYGKKNKSNSSQSLLRYIKSDQFVDFSKTISEGHYTFTIPVAKRLNKGKIGEYRTVYTFNPQEMLALSIIIKSLKKYDHLLPSNLYSFRMKCSMKDAINRIKFIKNLESKYFYKTDVRNYFNSIPIDSLLKDLNNNINDRKLCIFFEQLLKGDSCIEDGKIIHEKRGIMAGTPTSAFLSNFYIRDVDEYFLSKNCTYLRYCDDILIIANNQKEIKLLRDELHSRIAEKGLCLNEEKDQIYGPGESFDYLGLKISSGYIDISTTMFSKIKHKIRVLGRACRRKVVEDKVPTDKAIEFFLATMNDYFYGQSPGHYSFSKWYFPLINTSNTLITIDSYILDYCRYVATGRFSKKNYSAVPLRRIYHMGYRPLTNSFDKYVANNINMSKTIEVNTIDYNEDLNPVDVKNTEKYKTTSYRIPIERLILKYIKDTREDYLY